MLAQAKNSFSKNFISPLERELPTRFKVYQSFHSDSCEIEKKEIERLAELHHKIQKLSHDDQEKRDEI